MTRGPVIAVAIGDPNGIGPEIALAAACRGDAAGSRLLLVGDRSALDSYAAREGVALRPVDTVAPLPPASGGIVDLVEAGALASGDFAPGNCDAGSGRATVAYLETALSLQRDGLADAVIGCPHNETAVNAAGIPFRGYPDLLARLTGAPRDSVFLMLCGAGLRIAHATLHESTASALDRLDPELVYRAACTTLTALRHSPGSAGHGQGPRLGLFGIDPHAGEDGLFGDADDRITRPVAARLRREGHRVAGPAGADLLLAQGECDGYLAMFHDQGHIPVKLLAGRDSTAFSIGAGLLFASVGHGSAPDIAGRGTADSGPLNNTIATVAALCGGASQPIPARTGQ